MVILSIYSFDKSQLHIRRAARYNIKLVSTEKRTVKKMSEGSRRVPTGLSTQRVVDKSLTFGLETQIVLWVNS